MSPPAALLSIANMVDFNVSGRGGVEMNRRTRSIQASVIAGAALVLLLVASCPAEELSGYSGAQLYQRFCASCHGTRGLGDGPVAPSINSIVPDLTQITRRHGGDFPSEQLRRLRTEAPPSSRSLMSTSRSWAVRD